MGESTLRQLVFVPSLTRASCHSRKASSVAGTRPRQDPLGQLCSS